MGKWHTIGEMIKAVEEANGFLSVVAQNLGMTYQGVWDRVKKDEKLRAKIAEITERQLDKTESKLFETIEKGEAWAICFYLKCKGKHRGYVERTEIVGDICTPLTIEHRIAQIDKQREEDIVKAIEAGEQLPHLQDRFGQAGLKPHE